MKKTINRLLSILLALCLALGLTPAASLALSPFDVTVIGGSCSENMPNPGDEVFIRADDTERFVRWEDVYGNIQLKDPYSPETSFIMPSDMVRVRAIYGYRVIVEGGTADKPTATPGDTVTITADASFHFGYWDVTPSQVQLADIYAAETTFIMPDTDVFLTAYPPFHVSVENGKAEPEWAAPGQTVTVTADTSFHFGY